MLIFYAANRKFWSDFYLQFSSIALNFVVSAVFRRKEIISPSPQ